MLTSALATSVQRRAAVPNAQITFSTADFYAFMDEETESKLVPLILKNMEEFYVYDYPYNITNGVKSYAIPTRAIAGKLRDVQIIASNDPDSIVPLERLDVTALFAATTSVPQLLIQKYGFYIKNNAVVIYPTPQVTMNILNLEYYMRPSTCVDPSMCGLITTISGNSITVSSLPSNITPATPVDFVRSIPGFECTAIDQAITSISGNILTMTSTPPANLAVGDYVCQATQTCVVQVPQELLPLLSQYVVVRVLSAQGDLQAYQQAITELAKLEENANLLLAPRVSGKLKRVVNARGVLRFV